MAVQQAVLLDVTADDLLRPPTQHRPTPLRTGRLN